VRCFRPAVIDFLVTGLAGFRTHVLRRIRRRHTNYG
jgi:hypothetical protein